MRDARGGQLRGLRNHEPAHGVTDQHAAADTLERHRVGHRAPVCVDTRAAHLGRAPPMTRQVQGHHTVALGAKPRGHLIPAPRAMAGAVDQHVLVRHVASSLGG